MSQAGAAIAFNTTRFRFSVTRPSMQTIGMMCRWLQRKDCSHTLHIRKQAEDGSVFGNIPLLRPSVSSNHLPKNRPNMASVGHRNGEFLHPARASSCPSGLWAGPLCYATSSVAREPQAYEHAHGLCNPVRTPRPCGSKHRKRIPVPFCSSASTLSKHHFFRQSRALSSVAPLRRTFRLRTSFPRLFAPPFGGQTKTGGLRYPLGP